MKSKFLKILLPSEASLNLMLSFYKQDCNFHNFSSLVVDYKPCGLGVIHSVLQKKALLCSKMGCGTKLQALSVSHLPCHPPTLTAFVLQEPDSLWLRNRVVLSLRGLIFIAQSQLWALAAADFSEITFPTMINFKQV